jgi:5-methylcytosine-specific restriction endonuclease McrA
MGTNNLLNREVLLLNVNFEPLNVCTTRRALSLLLGGKAETIANGRGYIRTSTREFELPSIIRLNYMVRRPRQRIALSKREILRRDNYTCQYCGKKSSLLTIDHITPRHAGGEHSWTNLVAACQSCNRKKGGKTLTQANMRLLRKPFEPPTSARYRFNHHLARNEAWEPFLEGW